MIDKQFSHSVEGRNDSNGHKALTIHVCSEIPILDTILDREVIFNLALSEVKQIASIVWVDSVAGRGVHVGIVRHIYRCHSWHPSTALSTVTIRGLALTRTGLARKLVRHWLVCRSIVR